MAKIIHENHAWLSAVREDILEPERPIIDPHHHLWLARGGGDYLLPELWADTGDGHRVESTVFIECRASYRKQGPAHLLPVGETEFVTEMAIASEAEPARATIAGIVAYADLRSPLDKLDEVLDAHESASGGRENSKRRGSASSHLGGIFTVLTRQITNSRL